MERITVPSSTSCRSKPRSRVLRCRLLVLVTFATLIALGWTATASAASASIVHRGSSERKQIALTFDDNTSQTRALSVLRALQKNNVKATLFLVGSGVNAYPSINTEIVKGMSAGLFEVGDHSRSHALLTGKSSSILVSEIGGGTDAFRKATGARTVPLFRPPYGATNSQVAAIAGAEGFSHLVLWDIDPRDWEGGSADSIADHVVSRAHNGAIVVMHLSGAHTAEAVPKLASRLRAKGYELVTISEMLKGDRMFLDVSSDSDAGRAIARLVGGGFISGYNSNYFGPNDSITRAQVAKVCSLVGGIHTATVEGVDSPAFPDVPVRHDSNGKPLAYPFDYVQEAVAAGLVVGAPTGGGGFVFNPDRPITRVQLATILARMARQLKGYPSTASELGLAEPTFTGLPDYAVADVSLVAALGLMTGNANGDFMPSSGAKRAHVAMVMSRYLDLPAVWPPD